MDNSIIEKLIAKHAEGDKAKEVIIEREQEYRDAINRIAAMNEGKLLFKYMLKFCQLYQCDPQINPAGLIEEKGRKAFYLKMVRPYLERNLRMEIENYE